MTLNLIQIVGISIIFMAFWQTAYFCFFLLRTFAFKRRQWQAEMIVLERQIQKETLSLNHAQNKINGAWQGYRKFSVSKKQHEKKSGICSFYLKPHDGKAIPYFEPGQYLFFKLNIPSEKKPVLRCYSLSDSPSYNDNKDYFRVSIKKALPPRDKPDVTSGLGSSYFHDQINEGDLLDVRAPGGNFYLDILSHKPVVLIGGGVGITPVLSMLNTICDLKSQRETWFFLGVRNGDEHIMEAHFKKIEQEFYNIHIHICYSNPTDEDKKEKKYDHEGRVSIDLLQSLLPSNNYEFYFCGPPPMMESLESGLISWGVPKASVNFEFFGGGTQKTSAPALKDKILINFSRSKKVLDWDGSNSILELAKDNSITIDSSCKQGMCGLCQIPVKTGTVFYDEEPEYLSELEDGMCLVCVAKTNKKLELDA